MGRKRIKYPLTESQRERKQERQRRWIAGRRRGWFADKACADCNLGFKWCPLWGSENLELDHVDPRTKDNGDGHKIWSWSLTRREQELTKCQPLCKECHMEKTLREREGGYQRLGYKRLQYDVSEVPF